MVIVVVYISTRKTNKRKVIKKKRDTYPEGVGDGERERADQNSELMTAQGAQH